MQQKKHRAVSILGALVAMLHPAIAAQPENENTVIIIDDFENSMEEWSYLHGSLAQESAQPHRGLHAARFRLEEYAEAARPIAINDWSDYAAISFWVYSEAPTKAVVGVALTSSNTEAEGWSYFYKALPIDFSGWKHFVIRKEDFNAARNPNWGEIQQLKFSIAGWLGGWSFADSDKTIVLDEIKLLTEAQMTNEEAE